MEVVAALDAWIIQDGNYPDFRRGLRAEFALEFGCERLAQTGDATPELRRLRDFE